MVERVFSIPGLGNILYRRFDRDDTLVIGIVAFLSILIMFFNLIVDIPTDFLIRVSDTTSYSMPENGK